MVSCTRVIHIGSQLIISVKAFASRPNIKEWL